MDTEDLNGLILNSYYIPEEVVSYILSFVEPSDLVFRCRPVCKNWKYIIDENVWITKTRYIKRQSFSKLTNSERKKLNFPWYVYYAIFANDPYERNLIKNHCGQEKLEHWRFRFGDGFWEIEPTPVGADPLPNSEDFGGQTCCFASSYQLCKKKQLIELKEFGISDKIMDEFQPTITASEWYAGRYDCGCIYQLTVSLLNEDEELMHKKGGEKKRVIRGEGRKWEKVEYVFSNYGRGVRYIKFQHKGKDTQHWAGHYGSKMSGAVVKVSLPKPKNTDSTSSVSCHDME